MSSNLIKSIEQKRVNRCEVNQLLDPEYDFTEYELRKVLKYISHENLKKLVEKRDIDQVFNIVSKHGKISSLKCFKYVIATYEGKYRAVDKKKLHTKLLYGTLNNGYYRYAKYLMNKYYDIDYVNILQRFHEDGNEELSNYLFQRLRSPYSKIDYESIRIRLNKRIKPQVQNNNSNFEYRLQTVGLILLISYLIYQVVVPAIILLKLYYL